MEDAGVVVEISELHVGDVQRQLREEHQADVPDPFVPEGLVEHERANRGDGEREGEGCERGGVGYGAFVLDEPLDEEAHVHAVAEQPEVEHELDEGAFVVRVDFEPRCQDEELRREHDEGGREDVVRKRLAEENANHHRQVHGKPAHDSGEQTKIVDESRPFDGPPADGSHLDAHTGNYHQRHKLVSDVCESERVDDALLLSRQEMPGGQQVGTESRVP
mmetsp:Transcript_38628/g.83996  ORF Transcript_38628/g.83996 Transcript_38628/m.83996 type:complete len:219 (+) Transcript_38628:400-1056(+)